MKCPYQAVYQKAGYDMSACSGCNGVSLDCKQSAEGLAVELKKSKTPVVVKDDAVGSATRKASVIFGKVTREYDVIEDPQPHFIIETDTHVRGWYQDKAADKPRTCTSEYYLMTPYRGCNMCTFCYLPGMRGYYASGYMSVDLGYPDQVRRDLEHLNIAFPAYFSPFCESFNTLEPLYHNSERAARVCNEFNVPVMFTTKKQVPEWAWDVLSYNKYSSLQVSLNTSDNDVWRTVAPGADDVSVLRQNLAKAKEKGVYALLRVDPMLPFITTETAIFELVDSLKHYVDHVVFGFAEFGYAMKKRVFARYEQLFGGSVFEEFSNVYDTTMGGNYVPNTQFRFDFFNKMSAFMQDIGITMSTCSEWYEGEDGKLKPLNEYNTSKSCHGIVVPVHYKADDGKFYPLKGCHGACLSCPSNACGNKTLHQATALEYSVLKKLEVKVE